MQGTLQVRRTELRWRHHMGLPVIWDFRSRDGAFGGEGGACAVLSPHGPAPAMRGLTGPVAFLNLGGVGKPDVGLIRRCLLPETDGGPTGIRHRPSHDAHSMDLDADAPWAPFDEGGQDLTARGRLRRGALELFLGGDLISRRNDRQSRLDRN